jgi:hypothetical protein
MPDNASLVKKEHAAESFNKEYFLVNNFIREEFKFAGHGFI